MLSLLAALRAVLDSKIAITALAAYLMRPLQSVNWLTSLLRGTSYLESQQARSTAARGCLLTHTLLNGRIDAIWPFILFE